MARININVGTNANDGTGDDLRSAMQKINTNFTELYGTTAEANDLVEDGSPQLGGDLDVNGYSIISSSNGNISIVPNGTGNVVLGALTINGTTVSSDTSSKITLAESVDVTGTLKASTLDVNFLQSTDSSAIVINDSVNITGALSVRDLVVNELSSDDSTAIEIKENLNVQGDLKSQTIITNSIRSDDSSEITINDSVFISGSLEAPTLNTNVISSVDSSAIQIEDSVNVAGNIIPSTDNTYDLGSSTSRWKDLHVMEGTIYLWDLFNNFRTVTAQKIALIDAMISGGLQYSTDPYGGDAVITNQFSNNGVSIQGNSGAPVTVNEIEITASTIAPTTPDTLELTGTTVVDEIEISGTEITPVQNNTSIKLTPTGTGTVEVDGIFTQYYDLSGKSNAIYKNSSEVEKLVTQVADGTYTQLVSSTLETYTAFQYNASTYGGARITLSIRHSSTNSWIQEFIIANNTTIATLTPLAPATVIVTDPTNSVFVDINSGNVRLRVQTNATIAAGTVYSYTVRAHLFDI